MRDRVRAFVHEVAIPAEARDHSERGLDEGLRVELQERAKEWGIFGPQLPEDLGGLGLDLRGAAVILEEAGYSVLGPQALNCAAPDEGNMHMLGLIATAEQRRQYLVPLAAGEIRSCFSMTEPAPGAGSDPSMLQTTAERVGGGWSISGRKWFIAGAEGAAVLGAVGEGFAYAQVRLAPARLMSEVRPFRIYDGSTETHLWSIARRTLRARATSSGSSGAGE